MKQIGTKTMKQKIHINDQGELLLIEPENSSQLALAEAIEKGIKFRDQEAVKAILAENLTNPEWDYVKDRPKSDLLDLPNSYTAEMVEDKVAKEHNARLYGAMDRDTFIPTGLLPEKLAVLIPLKKEPKRYEYESECICTDQCLKIVNAKCRRELGNEARKEAGGKSFEDTLPFIEWYSGMEGVKIRHAYERYCREVLK